MIHPTPTKTLLTTTFEPLVMQLSGLLARGTRLIEQFVQAEPTPTTTMAFERELSALLREVGRRTAWSQVPCCGQLPENSASRARDADPQEADVWIG